MDIEQLQQFLKVAELGNFTRASEVLNISQPALSRSIGRLEEELGQPLFERQSRKVTLTDAGHLLQSRAHRIVSLVEDTKAEICDDGESGRIRLGAIPTIAPFFLPEMLSPFAQAFPKAHLTVQEDTTDNLLRRCQQGEIDLAILALPITAKHLEIEPLFEEELLLVLPVDHPLCRKKLIKLADVEPYPFVLLDEAHCLSDNIVTFCRHRSFNPISVERTSQLATVQELVSLNHGVSMIPAMAKKLDTSQRRVYRSLAGTKPTRRLAMIWNPYRFQCKLLERFKEHIRSFSQSYSA
ncbi:LysR family transcriptional regulator [Blastopirellula marina]|uniref:Hyalin n=1 Tax=Blastopirellula marina TaxID=124 RepID=A0A2S8G926_9BACT|nr:LysR family transcriptional regulator [Blastopirellula marina]PQO40958.1 hyalin [Blastopirellula marina]PTL45841.1 LysR family transcriptional regulator [Blastopirellula marina]